MRMLSFVDANPAQVLFLRDRRPVLIDELIQYNTYGSLILGVPNDALNARIPGSAADYAKERFGPEPAPFVIQPKLVSYSIPQQQQLRKPGGEFEPVGEVFTRIGKRLPKITCIASLRCPVPLQESGDVNEWFRYSHATVVWFQEGFAFPIDGEAMAQIAALDWYAIAADASD